MTKSSDAALIIRVSGRRQRPQFLVIGCFLLAYVGYTVFGRTRWLGIVGITVFAAALIIGAIGLILGRRHGWEMRIDAEGVTARGQRTARWDEIAGVRVTSLFPAAPFNRPATQMAAFLPAPGRQLPPGPSVPTRGPLGRIGGRVRRRKYRSDLILLLSSTDADLGSLTAAVERFGQKQVVVVPAAGKRIWRRFTGR
ncbi:hypothetical protein M6D93_04010 [Jatrophihabitans telluris]|uniref:Uncharacterized protein n=1 Tax=Jatrophihabitans telluris TaxID=2038343 RepID=A0ABY4R098_9ACTN|nr:hypothetical protein [Jatrophihabitans telluris]UQX89174.1 hypothetical protein M6D93_04010 [Jatrophihabitans telluris]